MSLSHFPFILTESKFSALRHLYLEVQNCFTNHYWGVKAYWVRLWAYEMEVISSNISTAYFPLLGPALNPQSLSSVK